VWMEDEKLCEKELVWAGSWPAGVLQMFCAMNTSILMQFINNALVRSTIVSSIDDIKFITLTSSNVHSFIVFDNTIVPPTTSLFIIISATRLNNNFFFRLS